MKVKVEWSKNVRMRLSGPALGTVGRHDHSKMYLKSAFSWLLQMEDTNESVSVIS